MSAHHLPVNTCPRCGALTGWRQVRMQNGGISTIAARWRHREDGKRSPWCPLGETPTDAGRAASDRAQFARPVTTSSSP